MRNGFTLRTFLSILAIIFLMIIIAFSVQRRDKKEANNIIPELEEREQGEVINENINNEVINDINQEEISQENEEIEMIDVENDNDNIEIIEYNIDCGLANNLSFKAKQDLSSKINVDINLIKTISCQENTFSDYTLGTSHPGEIYNQIPTKGYVLIFSYDNQEYRYHANENNIIFIN